MLCDDLEERDGGGREVQEGRDICAHMADSPPCIVETKETKDSTSP